MTKPLIEGPAETHETTETEPSLKITRGVDQRPASSFTLECWTTPAISGTSPGADGSWDFLQENNCGQGS
jgi:hypothetical protein